MKIAAQNLALVAAVLASKACAEIQMYVRYTDNLINGMKHQSHRFKIPLSSIPSQ